MFSASINMANAYAKYMFNMLFPRSAAANFAAAERGISILTVKMKFKLRFSVGKRKIR